MGVMDVVIATDDHVSPVVVDDTMLSEYWVSLNEKQTQPNLLIFPPN